MATRMNMSLDSNTVGVGWRSCQRPSEPRTSRATNCGIALHGTLKAFRARSQDRTFV